MRGGNASEVTLEPGVLRLRDVRAILGRDFADTDFLSVFVLGRAGERPSCGLVELGRLRGGRGDRRGLKCGVCGEVGQALFTDNKGGFGCGGCLGRRTRRQVERTHHGWRQLGGQQEDELLREVLRDRPGKKVERVRRIVNALLADDRRRVMLTLSKADSAIEAASFGSW